MSEKKRISAESAVSVLPRRGIVGLGSGSTVAIFARILGELIATRRYDIAVVPSSYQAYQLAIENNIPLTSLDLHPFLHVTIDGADEVDPHLNLTKGGGAALLREKVIAAAAGRLVIIVDDSKLVDRLATRHDVPIEVLPFALGFVTEHIRRMGITPRLREASGKLGPVVTDNGNFIVDLEFSSPIQNPPEMDSRLKGIPGVLETGLFVGMCDEVHIGTDDGVRILRRNNSEPEK